MKPWVFRQPVLYHRVFVGTVVVEDHVQIELRWSLPLQVPGQAVTDDGSLQDVEGGKKGGCAVAFVIVRHRSAAALFHGQARLGAIQGLNLALFIHTQHEGFIGRIEIESDHIGQLFDALLGLDPLLTRTRWCLLKRPEHLTPSQETKLADLLRSNLRTLRAYLRPLAATKNRDAPQLFPAGCICERHPPGGGPWSVF